MRLIIIRHGESVGNAKKVYQGQTFDTSLNEKGIEQAKRVAQSLKNEKIEAIYSSDLKRAMETAQEIAKLHNLKVIPDKRLREFHVGDLAHLEDVWGEFNKLREKAKKKGIPKYQVRAPGGESNLDHFLRVKDFFESLDYNGTVVIVAHAGTNKVFFGVLGHSTLDDMYDEIKQDNTAVNIVEIDNKGHKIIKINDVGHLK